MRIADFTQHEEQISRELSTLLDELVKLMSSFIKIPEQMRMSHKGDPPLTMSLRARLTSSATGLVEQWCKIDRHTSRIRD